MSDISDYSSDDETNDIIETNYVEKLFPIYSQDVPSKFARPVTVCMFGDVITNQVMSSYGIVLENLKCLGQFLSKCTDNNLAHGINYDLKASLAFCQEQITIEYEKCLELFQKSTQ